MSDRVAKDGGIRRRQSAPITRPAQTSNDIADVVAEQARLKKIRSSPFPGDNVRQFTVNVDEDTYLEVFETGDSEPTTPEKVVSDYKEFYSPVRGALDHTIAQAHNSFSSVSGATLEEKVMNFNRLQALKFAEKAKKFDNYMQKKQEKSKSQDKKTKKNNSFSDFFASGGYSAPVPNPVHEQRKSKTSSEEKGKEGMLDFDYDPDKMEPQAVFSGLEALSGIHKEGIKGIHTLDDKTRGFLADLMQTMKDLFDKGMDLRLNLEVPGPLRSVVDMITGFVTSTFNFVAGSPVTKLFTGLGVVLVGFFSSKRFRLMGWTLVSAGIYLLNKILPDWEIFQKLRDRLTSALASHLNSKDEEPVMEPQSFTSGLVQDISSFVSMVMVYILGPEQGDPHRLQKWCDKLTKFPNLTGGIHKFGESFLMLIQSVLNQISSWLGIRKLELMSISDEKVQDFLNRVTAKANDQAATLDLSLANREHILQLQREASEIRKDLGRSSSPDRVLCSQRVSEAEKLLSSLLAKLSKAGIDAGASRWEPLGILLVGAPGVGKTVSSTRLGMIAASYLIGDDTEKLADLLQRPGKHIYNRVSEEEFFTNYNNQEIFMMDDIGQRVDVPGATCVPFFECFRAVNTNSWQLHMADLSDKGTKVFTSSMVLMTSNILNMGNNIKSIHSPEAFMRRFESFLVVPKWEYCEGFDPKMKKQEVPGLSERRLRSGALLDLTHKERNAFIHLEYYRWDCLRGLLLDSTPWSFADMKEYVCKRLDEKKDKGDKLNRDHKKATVMDMAERFHWDPVKTKKVLDETLARFDAESAKKPVETLKNYSIEELFPGCEPGSRTHMGRLMFYNLRYYLGDKHSDEEIYTFLRTSKVLDEFVAELDSDEKALIPIGDLDVDDDLAVKIAGRITDILDEFSRSKCPKTFFSNMKATVERMKTILPLELEQKVEKISNKIAICGSMLASIGLATFMYSYFSGVELSTQSFHKDAKVTGREKSTRVERFGGKGSWRRNEGFFEPQGSLTNQLQDEALSICKKNQVVVKIYDPVDTNKEVFSGQILFFQDCKGFMPMHYADVWESLENNEWKGRKMILHYHRLGSPEADREISIDDISIKSCFLPTNGREEDLVVVTFSKMHQRVTDIVSRFVSEGQHPQDASMINTMMITSRGQHALIVNSGLAKPFSDNVMEYRVNKGIVYNYPTIKGDCGAAIFQDDGKIVGIHVAGDARRGVAYFITLEHVKKMIAEIGGQSIIDPLVEREAAPPGVLDHQCSVHVLGKQGPVVHTSKTTKKGPSSLARFRGVSPNKPAYLTDFTNPEGERVQPLVLAWSKLNVRTKYIFVSGLCTIADNYMTLVLRRSMDDPHFAAHRNVLSKEVACAGIPGIVFLDGINRATSSGFPYCTKKGREGKKDFFGADGPYDFSSDECKALFNDVDNLIEKAKQGIRSEIYYADFPKDETRPIAKVNAGKTRLISGSPLHYTIALRMYCADFVRWFMYNNVTNGSGVGVNPFGPDWTRLCKHMRFETDDGSRVIAGDFSNFDGSLSRPFISQVLSIINRYYASNLENKNVKEDELVRTVLFEDIMNPRHVTNGIAYEVTSGMPSGNTLTSIINTIVNNLLIRYAILVVIMGDPSIYEWEPEPLADHIALVEQEVRIICYGDDNVISIGGLLSPYVTQGALTSAFAVMGFSYTSDDKESGANLTHRHYSQVTFLKRHFVREGRDFIAPILTDVIHDMVRWTKPGSKSSEIERANVHAALREAALHSRAYYESFAEDIRNACASCMDYHPTIEEYSVVRRKVREAHMLLGQNPA